jgi:O-antigen ligase/Flp pilus assembly protein TadD
MRILPSIPLVVISALVIFSPLQEGGTTHSAQMIIRLLIVLWLGIVLAQGIRAGSFSVPLLPVGYIALSFVGLAVLATLFSPYPHPSRQWLLMIVGYVTFFYLLVSFVDRWEHIRTVTMVIVLMGVGEAGWAIMQGLAWNVSRPSGTFFNPNFLAGYLTVTWAILLSYALYGDRRRSSFSTPSVPPVLWWLSLGSALCGVFLAVLLTQSRGGMIVFFVATLFILTVRYGWKLAGGCAVVLVLIGLLIPTSIRDRVLLEHHQNPATYARWQMWQGAIRQMIDHPLGIGLGLYQYTYPRYAFPVEGEISRYGKTAQTPHNDYLQMGIEMGVGAMLVFAFGVAVVWRELMRVLRGRLLRWQRSLMVGVGGGGVALLVHAAFDSSLRESAIAILLILCGGLIIAARRLIKKGPCPIRVIPIRSQIMWGIGVASVLLIVSTEALRLGLAWMMFESASRHAMTGETAAAIQGLNEAISLDPGKSLYHHSLGAVYARVFETTGEKQAFQNAHIGFSEAIALNPLDSRLAGLLAQLYVSAAQAPHSFVDSTEQRRRWWHAAAQAYEQAIQLAPFSAMYRYEQARLHWMLGERHEAERCAKEAQALEPNFLPARALLARLWVEEGQVDGAKTQLHEIQERQTRYKQWRKNSLDHAFLNVDVTPIRLAIREQEFRG